jgi:hypothetical protein
MTSILQVSQVLTPIRCKPRIALHYSTVWLFTQLTTDR